MTHEELLAKIDSLSCCSGAHELALLEVIKLHTPWHYTYPNAGRISYCSGCPNDSENGQPEYPCDTIQVIESALQ